MLSEEEEILIKKLRYCEQEYEQNGYLSVGKFKAIKEAVNLIEKQSKEIERTNEIIIWKQRHEEQLQKEIEELKEERKSYAEEYIHNNPWLYKQLNENYILRVESEQKERKAWIKGTNDADELCNKKWEDKIKAIIEELEKQDKESKLSHNYLVIPVLQSLLEKE